MRCSVCLSLLVTLLLTVTCTSSTEEISVSPAPKSLESLIVQAVRAALARSRHLLNDLVMHDLKNVDWEKDDVHAVFQGAPCSDLCQVCWMLETTDECEDFCENTCHWRYTRGADHSKSRRSLVDICLGLDVNLAELLTGDGGLLSGLGLGGEGGILGGLLGGSNGGGILGGLLGGGGGAAGGAAGGGGGAGGLLGGLTAGLPIVGRR